MVAAHRAESRWRAVKKGVVLSGLIATSSANYSHSSFHKTDQLLLVIISYTTNFSTLTLLNINRTYYDTHLATHIITLSNLLNISKDHHACRNPLTRNPGAQCPPRQGCPLSNRHTKGLLQDMVLLRSSSGRDEQAISTSSSATQPAAT